MAREPFDLEELVAARDRWAVSARVFVQRIELYSQDPASQLRHDARLSNLVIGVGEWSGGDRVDLSPMPFRSMGGLIPEFVAQLRNRKKLSIANYLPSTNFYLNGGSDASSSEKVWFGTSGQPQSEQAIVEVSVERVARRSGEAFLWMCRRLDGEMDKES